MDVMSLNAISYASEYVNQKRVSERQLKLEL